MLDPALNRAPQEVHHIHIMGVCGTGMAALAGMLKREGYLITGSDNNVYPPMSDFLHSIGVEIMNGYGPCNLEPRPDLVIVGNVIRAVNPEALALREQAISYLSMPQALGRFFLDDKKSLVVAGTHGKTTTSSMLATVLNAMGADPGCLIGGFVEAFGGNFRLGSGKYFVIEGDEYDTAFFDKGSKFLHYRPFCAILTSIEFDHADIFTDLEVIKNSFKRFVSLIPPEGFLVACHDDPVVREICGQAVCRVIYYGSGEECDYRFGDLRLNGPRSVFNVTAPDRLAKQYSLAMPGKHNGLNATGVIALLSVLGFAADEIKKGLASFTGVRRRQQIRGEVGGVMVIDDFAHHPTAVRETTAALRLAWPERRLIIVFEPRTNSSRRSVFQESYADSFHGADLVVVREHVPLADVERAEQFSSEKLVSDLKKIGISACYFPDTDAILDFLGEETGTGDIVAVLSNGGFDNIHQRLLTRLEEKSSATPKGESPR
ncbi:MAG: UDP-N-acetylmuramate--L-alanine ligase [Desulfobulbaceae bacterium]|nr:UDP-N-acetylmuramate--L-alanine ligase [Desulfobulbaceae bacterium]